MLKTLTVYSGLWDKVPQAIIDHGVEVKFWSTETQKEMYDFGYALVGTNSTIFTNNDHVLNGIRVAIMDRKGEKNPTDVSFIYFDGLNPAGTMVIMDRLGGFDHWPTGFFDHIDFEHMKLIGGSHVHC